MAQQHDESTPRSIPANRTSTAPEAPELSAVGPKGGVFPVRQRLAEALLLTHDDGREELWNPGPDVELHGPWMEDLVADSLGNIADGLLLIEDVLWIEEDVESVELADGSRRTLRRLARGLEAALRRQAAILSQPPQS